MGVKAIRGFKDVLPNDSARWQILEHKARDIFTSFGLHEIRTPVIEKTEVFARGIGEHTDIVEKEMYTFQDRNGDSLTMRPEATAGIIRAVIEHKLYAASPLLKLYTMGPMFRHERPQKGRLRQFHQINAELLGSSAPLADAECIAMAWEIVRSMTDATVRLEINSLGCPKCRPLHRQDLLKYLHNAMPNLCEDCRRRAATNPLRILDCKNDQCARVMKQAPLPKHYHCVDCASHLGLVLDYLEFMDIPFVQNPYLVRGLDYYVRTTFEIKSPELGAQSTVAAGGRYDGLVKMLGGPDISGVGMAVGVERLLLLSPPAESEGIDLFVAALGREARETVIPWIHKWRMQGLAVETAWEDKSLKAQMKQANRSGADLVLIVGEDEIDEEKAILRDMKTGDQDNVEFDSIVDTVLEVFD